MDLYSMQVHPYSYIATITFCVSDQELIDVKKQLTIHVIFIHDFV